MKEIFSTFQALSLNESEIINCETYLRNKPTHMHDSPYNKHVESLLSNAKETKWMLLNKLCEECETEMSKIK